MLVDREGVPQPLEQVAERWLAARPDLDPADVTAFLALAQDRGEIPTWEQLTAARGGSGARSRPGAARGTRRGSARGTRPVRLVDDVLLDVTHTATSPVVTGVERVVSELARAWCAEGSAAVRTVGWVGDGRLVPLPFDPDREPAGDAGPLSRLAGDPRVAALVTRTGAGALARRAYASLASRRTARAGGDPVLPDVGAALVTVETVAGRSPAAFSRVRALLRATPVRSLALVMDLLPLVEPRFVPADLLPVFLAYAGSLPDYDALSCISAGTGREVRAWLDLRAPARRPDVAVDPLPWPPPDEAGAPGLAERGRVVLAVGAIEPRKNYGVLLAAAERLWADGVAFELRLVASARAGADQALAEMGRLRAAGRPLVVEQGLPGAELAQRYAHARVLAHPALAEGFGLPLVEALRHGTPVVCADVGVAADLARAGGVVLTDVTDPGAFARALRPLLVDDEAWAVRHAAALTASAAEHRTWSDWAAQVRTRLPPAP